jgi:hypothetical protein
MQGSFLVVTQVAVPAGRDRELDRYIHNELFTSLLAIPSAARVTNLRLVKGDGPPQVVVWETKRWGTSVMRAYEAVIRSDSAKTSAFAGQPRAVYQETTRFSQAQVGKEGRRHLLLVQMDIPPGFEDEFNKWYDSEHIPMLMQISGWMAAVRYILIMGDAPKYMTTYELEGPGALDMPEHEMTHRTEWYRRVKPHFENFSSLLYERLSELQR